MSDMLHLAPALCTGCVLGAFFFGGLWWTVQKGVGSSRPELWFVGSLLLRTAVVLTGFYLVAQGDWSRLAACLVGFLSARVIVMKWLARPTCKEAGHGP